MKRDIDDLIIHTECGLPIELCECPSATIKPIECEDCNGDGCEECEGYGHLIQIKE